MTKLKVAIIMGSDSDLPIMKDAATVLKDFDVEYELTIVSAHRTPDRMVAYAKDAVENGFAAIIAGAGGAAHLPGMVASMTTVPVIGVPIDITSMKGLDSLLSIVQMPKGVPVATVAINNAANAGLLALRILSVSNDDIRKKLESFQDTQRDLVLEKVKKLDKNSI